MTVFEFPGLTVTSNLSSYYNGLVQQDFSLDLSPFGGTKGFYSTYTHAQIERGYSPLNGLPVGGYNPGGDVYLTTNNHGDGAPAARRPLTDTFYIVEDPESSANRIIMSIIHEALHDSDFVDREADQRLAKWFELERRIEFLGSLSRNVSYSKFGATTFIERGAIAVEHEDKPMLEEFWLRMVEYSIDEECAVES